MRYEWWVSASAAASIPKVLLLSTSDTDLTTARCSGARYRWANPARLAASRRENPGTHGVSGTFASARGVVEDLAALLDGVDVVVLRLLGGYRVWQDIIDAVVASGVPAVVVSGEQAVDAELMGRSTVAAGVAVQAHLYLAHGGVENFRQLHAFLSDTVLMTGFGFAPPVVTRQGGCGAEAVDQPSSDCARPVGR